MNGGGAWYPAEQQQRAVSAHYPDENHPYENYLSYGGAFGKRPQYGYAGIGTYEGIEPGAGFITEDDE